MPGRAARVAALMIAAGLVSFAGCTAATQQSPARPSVAASASMAPSSPSSSTSSPAAAATPSTAAPAPAGPVRFAIASDGHLGDPKADDSAQDFTELVDALNTANAAERLNFAVINGDITDRGGVVNEKQAAQRLAALQMPLLVLQGNHDRLTADQWRSVWQAPGNQVLTYGTVSLILANTSNQAGDELCADESWLADALRQTSGQRAVLVVMHVTPSDWTKFGVDCPGVRTLLARAGNVRAVFNGHDHDQIGMKQSLGVRYFFDGHFGGHWGTPQKTYRLVEVAENGLDTSVISLTGEVLNTDHLDW